MSQPVTNLDPSTATPPSYHWASYDSLVWEAPDGTMVPSLATAWKYTDASNTSFELTIREGVLFSDGDKLDAAAVKGSLDRFLGAEGNRQISYAGPIKSVEVTGDYTVVINYTEAFPVAELSLTQDYNFGLIISPTGVANPESLATETHGAGAYVLDAASTVADSEYTFTARDDYWNPDAQKFDKVVLKVISDPSAQLAALESGQIDYANNVAAVNVQAGIDSGFNYTNSGGGVWFLMLQDRTVAPLDNPKVREAISYAIDRESIASAIFSGWADPVSSIATELSGGDYGAKVITQDLAKAKSLLAEAGYADGFTLTAVSAGAVDINGAFVTALKDQLAQAGITLELNITEGNFGTFLEGVAAAQTTAFQLTNMNLYYQMTQNILSTESLFNKANTVDDEANRLLAEASVASAADQDAAFQALAKRVDSLNWNIPVALAHTNHLTSTSLANVPATSKQVTITPFSPDASYAWEFTK